MIAYLNVPIKYSSIVPKIKIPKQFEKIWSKYACNRLLAIQRKDWRGDSLNLGPYKFPNKSKVSLLGGRNFYLIVVCSNP